LTQILKPYKIRAILTEGFLCKIAHFKTFAISLDDAPRLIEELSKQRHRQARKRWVRGRFG